MKNITIQLFEFSELSHEAKAKALESNRDINVDNDYWYDSMYEHFCEVCKILGICTEWKTICFRGFWSQGDGSAFKATVDISTLIKAIQANALKEPLPEITLHFPPCPCDKRVIALIEKGLIDAWCKINQPSHQHYSVSVDADFNYSYSACRNYGHIDRELNLLEHWISGIADTLNHYLYEGLRHEYEQLVTDALVQESIEANAYPFTKDGQLATHIETLSTH